MNIKYTIVGLIIIGISLSMFVQVVEQKQDFEEKGLGEISAAVVSEIIDINNGHKNQLNFNNILPYILLMSGVISFIAGLSVNRK